MMVLVIFNVTIDCIITVLLLPLDTTKASARSLLRPFAFVEHGLRVDMWVFFRRQSLVHIPIGKVKQDLNTCTILPSQSSSTSTSLCSRPDLHDSLSPSKPAIGMRAMCCFRFAPFRSCSS